MANEIYNDSWWGRGALNDIGWGDIYRQYVDPTDLYEVIAENGDYVITEAADYVTTE